MIPLFIIPILKMKFKGELLTLGSYSREIKSRSAFEAGTPSSAEDQCCTGLDR